MRVAITTIIFSALSLSLVSCIRGDVISVSDIESQNEEFLIFGTYYSFHSDATLDTTNTYKLTNHALYVDSSNSRDINNAQFIRLDNEKFNLVKNLIDAIPPELIVLNDSTFGCPDCADQGGINIRYHKDGSEKRWVIDQYNHYTPRFLHGFKNDIIEKIQLINSKSYDKATFEK